MAASIMIPEGTKVLAENGGIVTLRGLVIVDAIRLADGSYKYEVGGRKFIASAGTVRAVQL